MVNEELEFTAHLQLINILTKRIICFHNEDTKKPLLSLSFTKEIPLFSADHQFSDPYGKDELATGYPYAFILNIISKLPKDPKDSRELFQNILSTLANIGYKPANPCTIDGLVNGSISDHNSLATIIEWAIIDRTISIEMIVDDLKRLPRSFFILNEQPAQLDDAIALWLSKFPVSRTLPQIKSIKDDMQTGQHIAFSLSRIYPKRIPKDEINVGPELTDLMITENWTLIQPVLNELMLFSPPGHYSNNDQLCYMFFAEVYHATRPGAKKFIKLEPPPPIVVEPRPYVPPPPPPVKVAQSPPPVEKPPPKSPKVKVKRKKKEEPPPPPPPKAVKKKIKKKKKVDKKSDLENQHQGNEGNANNSGDDSIDQLIQQSVPTDGFFNQSNASSTGNNQNIPPLHFVQGAGNPDDLSARSLSLELEKTAAPLVKSKSETFNKGKQNLLDDNDNMGDIVNQEENLADVHEPNLSGLSQTSPIRPNYNDMMGSEEVVSPKTRSARRSNSARKSNHGSSRRGRYNNYSDDYDDYGSDGENSSRRHRSRRHRSGDESSRRHKSRRHRSDYSDSDEYNKSHSRKHRSRSPSRKNITSSDEEKALIGKITDEASKFNLEAQLFSLEASRRTLENARAALERGDQSNDNVNDETLALCLENKGISNDLSDSEISKMNRALQIFSQLPQEEQTLDKLRELIEQQNPEDADQLFSRACELLRKVAEDSSSIPHMLINLANSLYRPKEETDGNVINKETELLSDSGNEGDLNDEALALCLKNDLSEDDLSKMNRAFQEFAMLPVEQQTLEKLRELIHQQNPENEDLLFQKACELLKRVYEDSASVPYMLIDLANNIFKREEDGDQNMNDINAETLALCLKSDSISEDDLSKMNKALQEFANLPVEQQTLEKLRELIHQQNPENEDLLFEKAKEMLQKIADDPDAVPQMLIDIASSIFKNLDHEEEETKSETQIIFSDKEIAKMNRALHEFSKLPKSQQTMEQLHELIKQQNPENDELLFNQAIDLLRKVSEDSESTPHMLISLARSIFRPKEEGEVDDKTLTQCLENKGISSDLSEDEISKMNRALLIFSQLSPEEQTLDKLRELIEQQSPEDAEKLFSKACELLKKIAEDPESIPQVLIDIAACLFKKSDNEDEFGKTVACQTADEGSTFEQSCQETQTNLNDDEVVEIEQRPVDMNLMAPIILFTRDAVQDEAINEDNMEWNITVTEFPFRRFTSFKRNAPTKRSSMTVPNYKIIANIIRFNAMPAPQQEIQKRKLLTFLKSYDTERMVVLLSALGHKMKSIYILRAETGEIIKIWGSGPSKIYEKDVGNFYKYICSVKQFDSIPSKHFTQTTDAICMKRGLEPRVW